MTENVTVTGGRLKVERVAGKPNIDLDLATVEYTSYTRGIGGPGALVLSTSEGDHLVRVDQDDAPALIAQVKAAGAEDDEDPDLLDLVKDEPA